MESASVTPPPTQKIQCNLHNCHVKEQIRDLLKHSIQICLEI